MSEPVTPPAPPDGGAGTPPAGTPLAPVGAAPAPFVPTKEEWVESRKEQRQIRDLLSKLVPGQAAAAPTAPAPAAPATAPDLAAQVEDMRMDLAIERALRVAKVADTDPLAETLIDLVKAKRPPDVAAFVAQRVAALRPGGGSAPPAPAPVVPPKAPSNTGPPAGEPNPTTSIGSNPFKWGPEITNQLKDGEFHEAVKKWERSQGMGNPLSAMRAHAEAARKR